MLGEATRRRRASSIAEVVDIMTTLDRELTDTDGSVVVQSPVPAGDARRPRRGDDGHVPRSGIPRAARCGVRESVLRRGRRRATSIRVRHPRRGVRCSRAGTGAAPESIQFALAGMNAHINRDLPAGIVAAYRRDGRRARAGRHPPRRLRESE